MLPAALSILTTTFHEGPDRIKAISAWGAVAGLASAVGVFLGGVLSQTLGWRWVLFVNLPVCVLDLWAAFRLVSSRTRASAPEAFRRRRRGIDDRRHAPARLHPRASAPGRMERWPNHRGARRQRHAARGVCAQRAPAAQPHRPAIDLQDQGARRSQRHATHRHRRVLRHVLLRHPLHAERARFLPPPRWHGLPPRDGRSRRGLGDLLEAVRQDGHPTDHRQRRARSPPPPSTFSPAYRSTVPI